MINMGAMDYNDYKQSHLNALIEDARFIRQKLQEAMNTISGISDKIESFKGMEAVELSIKMPEVLDELESFYRNLEEV